mgnify:CR=1 FL=1|jgi:hypothetical protein
MAKKVLKAAPAGNAKGKPGRKNKTGIAFPNSNRAYNSLNHQEKKKFLTYQKEYVKEHYRTYLIRMNVEDDADIIAWLEEQENKSDYVRKCIAECRERALKSSSRKQAKKPASSKKKR